MGAPPALVDDGSDPGSWLDALRWPNSIQIIDGARVADAIALAGDNPPATPPAREFIEAVSVPADTSTPAVSEKHGGGLHSNVASQQVHGSAR